MNHKNNSISRRQLLQGAGALGAYAALHRLMPAYAQGGDLSRAAVPRAGQGAVDVFDMIIGETPFTINGRTATAQTVNGTIPGPLLRMREGREVLLRVKNALAETSSIHWHGLIVPMIMDGVPGVSFAGIEAGTTYDYHYKVLQSGTYWYHSHSGGQELRGVYGPIIIDPIESEPFQYDRDYVVMLSEWSFMMPHTIVKKDEAEIRLLQLSTAHRRRVRDRCQQVRAGQNR